MYGNVYLRKCCVHETSQNLHKQTPLDQVKCFLNSAVHLWEAKNVVFTCTCMCRTVYFRKVSAICRCPLAEFQLESKIISTFKIAFHKFTFTTCSRAVSSRQLGNKTK